MFKIELWKTQFYCGKLFPHSFPHSFHNTILYLFLEDFKHPKNLF